MVVIYEQFQTAEASIVLKKYKVAMPAEHPIAVWKVSQQIL